MKHSFTSRTLALMALLSASAVCRVDAQFFGGRDRFPFGMGRPSENNYRMPRELRELREQFTLRALASGRTLADQYSKALADLEIQAADAGEYETALAAQERRRQLADAYSNQNLDTSHQIILKPADAKTGGALTVDRTDGCLSSWRPVGSYATWDIFKITPGSYTVSMTYSAGSAGGEIEFGEVTGLTGNDTPKLSHEITPTEGWRNFETITLGTIKFSHNNGRVMLKATRLQDNYGLMHLKEIRLSPAVPTVEKTDREAVKQVENNFETLREAHLARLKEIQRPVLDAYIIRLTAMSDALIAKNDPDGAHAVLEEAGRAEKSLSQAETTARITGDDALSQGQQVITGAAYVEAASNTADRFLVSANDEKYSVKLMSVICPSPNPEDKAAHEYCMRYFGISLEDSIQIGRQARDFTAAYLKDKPLKLLTRGQKDNMQSMLATVIPADMGSLAGLLVDNGLAAVLEPSSKNNTVRKMEETTREALKHREAEARRKPVPPGAWSLSNQPTP